MVQKINEKLRNIFDKKHKQYYRDDRHIKVDKFSLLDGNIRNNIRRILKPRGYGPNVRNHLQQQPVTNSGNPNIKTHMINQFPSQPNANYNVHHTGKLFPTNIYLPQQIQPSHIIGNNLPQQHRPYPRKQPSYSK